MNLRHQKSKITYLFSSLFFGQWFNTNIPRYFSLYLKMTRLSVCFLCEYLYIPQRIRFVLLLDQEKPLRFCSDDMNERQRLTRRLPGTTMLRIRRPPALYTLYYANDSIHYRVVQEQKEQSNLQIFV